MAVLKILTVSGTLAAQDATVDLPLRPQANGGCSIQVTGTWTGTITFKVSADGTNYVSLYATDYATGAQAATTTANITVWANLVGVKNVQAYFTTKSSGTPSILITAANG